MNQGTCPYEPLAIHYVVKFEIASILYMYP